MKKNSIKIQKEQAARKYKARKKQVKAKGKINPKKGHYKDKNWERFFRE
jgi:hypothetical protein